MDSYYYLFFVPIEKKKKEYNTTIKKMLEQSVKQVNTALDKGIQYL